ncbi:S1 family peptidase [uncultured Cellulomonas sp.]|uniref:S1 family peptidase n=1 Tax=uncultured Cellulomonas sp. TaxID=189682 RepID=UPI0028E885D9|nr:S1 family peptidase [uncultured Cellulomonas sp.]
MVEVERTRPTGRVAIEAPLAADLRTIAAERGLSYARAVALYAWQNDFARLIEEARTTFPDTYVSAEITHDKAAPAWIAFTHVPTEWVHERLSTLPVAVDVRQVDALTEIEQNVRVQQVHYAVRALPGVAEVTSSIEPLTGDVAVTYSRSAATSRQATVPDSLAASLPDEILAEVSLEEVAGPIRGEEATLYGGAQLTRSGANWCTSGFTVSKNGVRGILTAAHCDTPLNYGASIPLYPQQSTTGSQGDLRWLSTSESVTNRVYISATASVAISSTGSPVVGQTLSFYGRKTGASTDEVYKLNECSGSYCNMTMMHRHKTDGGDSGGPWRSGSTAYGVHHGYKSYLAIGRSLFSRVGLANVHLGVAIRTSP